MLSLPAAGSGLSPGRPALQSRQRKVNSLRLAARHTMRVVIKVGTSLIAPGGQIDINLLRGMVDQFDLSKNEYLIVTSGAIAAGMSGLALEKRPSDVPRMQACAAVGQSKLMHTYERLFSSARKLSRSCCFRATTSLRPCAIAICRTRWRSCSRWAWFRSSMRTTASRCANSKAHSATTTN